ncbi:hypothetical protein JL721_12201 [Aureococcus anophagefferens]|nr:hypothetical protein JL721_12201 [Aureococcus anophagefferens]
MPVGSGVPEYALNPDEHGNKKRWFVLDPSGGRLRYFEDAHLNREAGQPSQSAASEPPTPSKRLVGGGGDFEMMEFFCLDNEATAAHLDSIGYGELLARWRSGGVDRDTKVYCGDTGPSATCQRVALDGDRRTSFFEDAACRTKACRTGARVAEAVRREGAVLDVSGRRTRAARSALPSRPLTRRVVGADEQAGRADGAGDDDRDDDDERPPAVASAPSPPPPDDAAALAASAASGSPSASPSAPPTAAPTARRSGAAASGQGGAGDGSGVGAGVGDGLGG